MREPPADILRRLKPIPTYTGRPTTTPHDIVGVAPDGTPCGSMWWRPPRRLCSSSSRRPASAAGTSGRACPRCGSAWPAPPASSWFVAARARRARPPSRRWPARPPLADGIDLVMSSQAYQDYRVTGPPFLSVAAAGGRRAHRERGLGPRADAADGAERRGTRRRLADTPGVTPLCEARTQQRGSSDLPTSRVTGNMSLRITGSLTFPRSAFTGTTDCRRRRRRRRYRRRGRCHHRLRLLCSAQHGRLRRLRRQLPSRPRARGRRGHRRRRGPRHAHARAGRPRPDAALQLPGRLIGIRRGAGHRPGSGVAPVVRGEAPPPRHQRLPTQGRWHRELPLGPVGGGRPVLVRGPHGIFGRRGRRLRRRRAGRAGHPHPARAGQDPLLPAPDALAAVRARGEGARDRHGPARSCAAARSPGAPTSTFRTA